MASSNVNVEINGEALRELRKLAGLSVAELAGKVGCSAPYISLLETDPDRACSPRIFAAICDALRLSDRTLLMREATTDTPQRSAA